MGILEEEIKRILRDIEVEQAYGLPEEKKEEMLGIVAEMRRQFPKPIQELSDGYSYDEKCQCAGCSTIRNMLNWKERWLGGDAEESSR